MSARLVGLEDVKRSIRELGEFAGPQVCEKALLPIGKRLAGRISEKFASVTRTKSGRTRADFTAAVSKAGRASGVTQVLVGARTGKHGRAYISGFLERGTATIRARPHVRPVWDDERDKLPDEIARALRPAYEATVKRLARFARTFRERG
jgi:hypothetical protein